MLLIRATLAFLALPTIVAGVVPALMARQATLRPATAPAGLGFLAIGSFLLLWCVRDFFVSGKGTLAPWDPPKHLVIVGLYRHVRNPMYLAVLTIVAGWALLYRIDSIPIYLACLAVGFHLRVIFFEEPWLRRQFGAEWKAYESSVPRWLPKLRRRSR